jgi:hypothetical protein
VYDDGEVHEVTIVLGAAARVGVPVKATPIADGRPGPS